MSKPIVSTPFTDANIKVHTAMAHVYNDSPHFREENKKKVRDDLLKCVAEAPSRKSMLDLGCGTGFIIDLIHDQFDEIFGVDITPAMLKQVNLHGGKVKLHVAQAESTPFADQSFDMVTAYSFLDHLPTLEPVFKEIYRVLKPGGVFYSGQTANYYFWQALKDLEKQGVKPEDTPEVVRREFSASLHQSAEISKEYDFSAKEFEDAEYIKSQKGGVHDIEVMNLAQKIGFKKTEIKFHWYLGQAKIMHQQSFTDSQKIEDYLNMIGPLARPLFKYIEIKLWR